MGSPKAVNPSGNLTRGKAKPYISMYKVLVRAIHLQDENQSALQAVERANKLMPDIWEAYGAEEGDPRILKKLLGHVGTTNKYKYAWTEAQRNRLIARSNSLSSKAPGQLSKENQRCLEIAREIISTGTVLSADVLADLAQYEPVPSEQSSGTAYIYLLETNVNGQIMTKPGHSTSLESRLRSYRGHAAEHVLKHLFCFPDIEESKQVDMKVNELTKGNRIRGMAEWTNLSMPILKRVVESQCAESGVSYFLVEDLEPFQKMIS